MKLYDPTLMTLTDTLDDIEGLRIATQNRLRIMISQEEDKDGQVRGFGLPHDNPVVKLQRDMLGHLLEIEKNVIKAVQKKMKEHPLGPWISRQKGVGEKQAARLLAAIGDPYWNSLHDRPRTVSELWAYCGMSVVDGKAQRRQKGVKSNWSNTAKMRARLIAESCLKNRASPYRRFYDETREKYKDAEITDLHSHNRGLRKMTKQFLKDLWRESKRIYQEGEHVEEVVSVP